MTRRRRIHHHVDRKRDHRTRPVRILVDLAEQQIHRHGHAVIDLHLVADGEIEFVENDRLRNVRGQRRITLHHRNRTRTPAFVGGWKFRSAAERKGRDHLNRKRRRVVVVDDDRDIRLALAHPFLGFLETREHPLPVRLLGSAVVDCCADGRHMRRSDTCDDSGHGSTSVLLISLWTSSPWLSLSAWGRRRAASPARRQ